MKQQRPSEVIGAFLQFLQDAEEIYQVSYQNTGNEDRKVQTFLHDIEFATDRNQRNKVATNLHRSRNIRIKEKDQMQLHELIHEFLERQGTQKMVKELRKLMNDQVAREKYLFGKREFKNRVE